MSRRPTSRQAREVARRIRAGSVAINHAFDFNAPFGGYKSSGNGREWSEFGFDEYLEIKGTLGYAPTPPSNCGPKKLVIGASGFVGVLTLLAAARRDGEEVPSM